MLPEVGIMELHVTLTDPDGPAIMSDARKFYLEREALIWGDEMAMEGYETGYQTRALCGI